MKRELGYKLPVQVLGAHGYRVYEDMTYYSPRYKKRATIRAPYWFDGATGGMDIMTRAIPHHDWFCDGHPWDDGSYPTRWQMSMVLHDQLNEDGFYVRAIYWPILTWLPNPMQGVTGR